MGLTQEIADFVANTRFHAKATPKPSSNGEELLLAYTLGVEVECRIADAINPRHYQLDSILLQPWEGWAPRSLWQKSSN